MSRDNNGRFIKGNVIPEFIKEKISKSLLGKRRSPKTEFKKGIIPWNKGKPVHKMRGSNHPNWKDGISPMDKILRNSVEYKIWRKQVFERDGYMCQVCERVGIYLEAHHIKSWVHFPELRFDIDNGITLCLECHSLTDNYKGRGIVKQL